MGKADASRNFGKQETAFENGSLKPIRIHQRHHVQIKALVEHLLSLPDEEENSEGGDMIEDSEGGVKKEENMGVEAAVSASAEQAAPEQSEALEQSTLEEEAWEQEAIAGAATKKHSREDVTYNYFCCRGIPSTILQEKGITIGPSGIIALLQRFNYINGCWHHKDCHGSDLINEDGVSSHCNAARSSIRRERIPELFCRPTTVAAIAQSNETMEETITRSASIFKSVDDFSASESAQMFAKLLKVYGKVGVNFLMNESQHIFCYCGRCSEPVVLIRKRSHDDSDGLKCQKCKKELYNEKRRAQNYDKSHGDRTNSTTFAALLKSPKKRRLRARLDNAKRDILTHKMRKRRLEAMKHQAKSGMDAIVNRRHMSMLERRSI
jgi:hypothetical protein